MGDKPITLPPGGEFIFYVQAQRNMSPPLSRGVSLTTTAPAKPPQRYEPPKQCLCDCLWCGPALHEQ